MKSIELFGLKDKEGNEFSIHVSQRDFPSNLSSNDVGSFKIDLLSCLTKREPKPEFKVGDWVIAMMRGGDQVQRITGIFSDRLEYDNFNGTSHSHSDYKNYVRPATPKEIESHLKEIAEKKGYKDGSMVKPLWNSTYLYWVVTIGGTSYMPEDDTFYLGIAVYQQGKWAEIIPEKKRFPKTKEELHLIIKEYFDKNDGLPFQDPIEDFLKDYED